MIRQLIRLVTVRRALIAGLALALLLGVQSQGPKTVQAADVTLYYEQFCARTPGLVELELRWRGISSNAREVWLDLSATDNTWSSKYLSYGYVAGTGRVVIFDNFAPATTFYFRINQVLANGAWDSSPTFEITTVSCPTMPASIGATGPAGACHSSYSGACLQADAVDYDCEGGGGDGPLFVAGPFPIVGPDVYGLDDDGDGTACED
jgi:hypothetical protein